MAIVRDSSSSLSSLSFMRQAGVPFLASAALARLPAPMIQLGLLLSAAQLGLGFGLGGSMVAVLGLGSAVGAPLTGHLVDRIGAWRVLAGCLVLQGCATLGLALAAARTPPAPAAVLAAALVVGLTNPQVGAIARARWSRTLSGRPDVVPRAMAYEGVVDEVTFVVGPVLAGLLVATLPPDAVLFWFAALTVAAQAWFMLVCRRDEGFGRTPQVVRGSGQAPLDRAAALASAPRRFALRVALRDLRRVGVLVVAAVAVGCAFGATQTALSGTLADPGLVGLVYGGVGVGSALGGVVVGWLGGQWRPTRWLLVGAAVMAPAAAGLAWANGAASDFSTTGTLVASGAAALALGAGVGMTLVATYTLAHAASTPGRLTTVLAVIATAVTVGVSASAAVTGLLLEAQPALAWTPLGAACVLALVAAVAVRRAGSSRARTPAASEPIG